MLIATEKFLDSLHVAIGGIVLLTTLNHVLSDGVDNAVCKRDDLISSQAKFPVAIDIIKAFLVDDRPSRIIERVMSRQGNLTADDFQVDHNIAQ